MVEHQPSKLDTWVRFPSPASKKYARVAQLVEHDLAKVGVAGSSPVSRSTLAKKHHAKAWCFFVNEAQFYASLRSVQTGRPPDDLLLRFATVVA